MQKIIFGLMVAGILALSAPELISAGGDQVRGDEGVGAICQYQETGNAIFDGNELCVTPVTE